MFLLKGLVAAIVPLNILHIFDTLGIGGLEKGVVTLANHSSPDIRHTIICLRTSGPSAAQLPAQVPVIEMHKAAGNSPAFLLRLAREIRKQRPDLVHTRNWGGMDGIIAARLAGMSRIVHGEHGWDLGDPQGQSKKRRLIRRILGLGVREHIAVSRKIAAWLQDEVKVAKPVTQIYNGVDTARYTAGGPSKRLQTELGLPDSTVLIGIVARLDPIKDHATLLEAFAGIAAEEFRAHLVIIGDGPERQRLADHAGSNVHFLGNRSDVPELLPELDIFVLCSLNEGISNTILEAMACGIPVVASDVGGNPELVREGLDGRLFPAGDVATLRDCLHAYINNEGLRKEHGANGRQRVLEKFSIRAMVDQYEAVWRRVAKDSDG